LEFNVPFQHKYGYIRDETGTVVESTICHFHDYCIYYYYYHYHHYY